MLHLLLLILAGAVIWLTILTIPMILIAGLRPDDVRDLLLYEAYRSFTYEGDVIPGLRPGRVAQLVIRVFSRDDDRRRELVATALASTPRREANNDGGFGK